MLADKFVSYKGSWLAHEMFAWQVVAWLVMAVFLAGVARFRGEKPSWMAFVPFLQHFDFARKLACPPIVGLLLVLASIATRVIEYFYGPVSVARISLLLVLVPAYLSLAWRLVQTYRLRPAMFWIFFAPLLPFQLGLALLGAAWLCGARPFQQR